MYYINDILFVWCYVNTIYLATPLLWVVIKLLKYVCGGIDTVLNVDLVAKRRTQVYVL